MRRLARNRDGRGVLEPASLAGVEQEYRVLLDGQPVDFRWLIGRLPIDGRRIDPGDPLALRCAWGGLLTADDGEAEIAIPPVAVGPGWTGTVLAHLRAGGDELREALPPEFALEGYSTHLSFAMPDALNDRVCRALTRRFTPALLLLTGHDASPGMLVRPRPGRTELGLDHLDGDALRAAATFAAGAARTCAAAAAGDRAAARMLPPALRIEIEPAIRRYGFYVDRSAFGADVLGGGREARLRRRMGGGVTGQDMLEAAWAAARHGLVGADTADVGLLDAMVTGRAPLPTEGLLLPPGAEREPRSPVGSPFGDALRPYVSSAVEVRAQFVTWDFVVFRALCDGRVAYVNIPRDGLEAFLGALHRGRVDPVIREFVSTERERIELSDHSQTGEPGLYHGVGDPANLVPPERVPGGRGGARVPGGRRSKQRSRRTERPHPAPAAVPVAAKRSRRGLLVGAIVVALIAAGIGAAALAGGGGDPKPGAHPSTSAIASPAPVDTTVPNPTTAPAQTTAPSPTPSATETAPAAPTSLSGVYSVVVTVEDLGSPIEGVSVGDTSEGNWLLSTDCTSRPCSLELIGATFFGTKISASGPFQGRTFHGDAEAPLFCSDTASGENLFDFVQTGGDFSVHVTDAQRVAGVPQATAFKGSFDFSWAPPAGQGQPGCEKTSETDSFTGTIHETQPPKPLPSGAPTPPVAESAVIGTWDAAFDVVKANNIPDKSKGQDISRVFAFIPKCRAATGCPLTLIRERGDGVGQDTLKPAADGSYVETLEGTIDCGDGSADYVQTIKLKPDDAELVAGVWRATGMTGSYEYQQTPTAGTKGCKPSHELDRITATAQL